MRNAWFALALAIGTASCAANASAQGPLARIIPPVGPLDQRADIFPHPIYNNWVPYRKTYNRPRYIGGKIAAVIAPTSQEAMSWHENYENCNYANHAPGMIKMYNFPKPWEALPIEARPNRPLGSPPPVTPESQEAQAPTSPEMNAQPMTQPPAAMTPNESSPSDRINLPSDSPISPALETPLEIPPAVEAQRLELRIP